MRFDPMRSGEDWLMLFRQRAVETWGRDRAAAIDEVLGDIARSIGRVSAYEVGPEEEPFLLAAEPFAVEEL